MDKLPIKFLVTMCTDLSALSDNFYTCSKEDCQMNKIKSSNPSFIFGHQINYFCVFLGISVI